MAVLCNSLSLAVMSLNCYFFLSVWSYQLLHIISTVFTDLFFVSILITVLFLTLPFIFSFYYIKKKTVDRRQHSLTLVLVGSVRQVS